MNFCGVDPGASGAIAFIGQSGHIRMFDMPVVKEKKGKKNKTSINPEALCGIFRDNATSETVVAVERVNAMPGQGVTSMFSFGDAYGSVKTAPHTVPGVKVVKVGPADWKKHFGLIGEEKDSARLLAIEKFPDYAHLFARKKDGGRADSALIALYAKEKGL